MGDLNAKKSDVKIQDYTGEYSLGERNVKNSKNFSKVRKHLRKNNEKSNCLVGVRKQNKITTTSAKTNQSKNWIRPSTVVAVLNIRFESLQNEVIKAYGCKKIIR